MVTKTVSKEVAVVKRGRGRPRKNSEVTAFSRHSVSFDEDTIKVIRNCQSRILKEHGISLSIPQTICYAIFETLKK